ncbi:MAG: (d)CMP kinase [Phycisphaerales bacterium]
MTSETHNARTGRTSASGVGDAIVTIDGPGGAGKSSVAREAARRLGLDFLDTGAMYRAATALALDHGIAIQDEDGVEKLAREAHLRFDWTGDPPRLMAFGREMSARLRAADVDANVSAVAGLPKVRRLMVELQQRIGREHPRLLTEGRDQGSVVFPGALVKIYLTASVEARATRRADQIRRVDAARRVDEGAIAKELEARDISDQKRTVGPLTCPTDAEVVDTSALTFEQSVARVVKIVRNAMGEASP